MYTSSYIAKLLTILARPKEELDETNFKKYACTLKLYNIYLDAKRATVALFKEVFPDSLVGMKVSYGGLSPTLKSRDAFNHIETMIIELFIDQDFLNLSS